MLKKIPGTLAVVIFLFMCFNVIKAEQLNPNSSSGSSGFLLYKGWLYAAEPKKIKGFLFEVTIIPLTYDTGNAYLMISKGKERLKRKVEAGKDYLFSFKDLCFSVRCISCHINYPEAITVEIRKTEKQFISSSCSFLKEDYSGSKSLILSNGLVKLRIVPGKGGRIFECFTLPDMVNHLCSDARFSGGGIEVNEGVYPGSFYNQLFSYKLLKNTPEEVKLSFEMDKAVNNLLLKKIITIKKNVAEINLEIKEYNHSGISKPLALCLHPELNIGGIADREDRFFIPIKEGVKTFAYLRRGCLFLSPAEGWAGCCDRVEKVAYVSSFSLDEVKTVYIYRGPDRYNIELFTPNKTIKPLKALSLHASLFLIKGISGISDFKKGLAAYISLDDTSFSQDKEIELTVEVGSAFLKKKKLNGKIVFLKEGKKIKEIGKFNKTVSFEEPLEKKFSFSARDLADGRYEILLSVSRGKGEELLKGKKEIFLIGEAKKENTKIYEALKKRLEQVRQKYPSKREQLFEAFTLLEELRSAIEENSEKEILLKRKEINQALKRIK